MVLGGSESECQLAQDTLHRVLVNFGFEIKQEKISKPAQVFKYLGIMVDTVDMCIYIDEDKLKRVKCEVLNLLDKKQCKRKDLEEVAGLLAHCATVVKGGRTFARRIYNVLRDATSEVIELDECIQQDFIWWNSFVQWFNGKSRVLGNQTPALVVCTDASDFGFGGYSSTDYFWGSWSRKAGACPHSENPPINEVYDPHINVTELWPVVVAIHRWGVTWRNRRVTVVTDNTQVQRALNTGRSKNAYTMAWLREIFWVSAFYNINISAERIASADNIIADSLSRLNNDNCVVICSNELYCFTTCCRARCTAWGMGRDTRLVLGRQHAQG